MDWVTERLKLKDIYPARAAELAQETGMGVDDLELIRKGRVSERVEVQKGERAVVNYITTGAIDRDGEIVEPTGAQLKNYRKNPVVMWAHRYDQLPVAKNLWIKSDEKGLRAKTHFLEHDFADQVYRLYSESIYDGKKDTGPALKAFSIGFVPLKWDDDGSEQKDDKKIKPKRTYTEWELLEYSCVPVPSNPEALTIAVGKGLNIGDDLKKDLGIELVEEGVEIIEDLHLKPEETDEYIRIPVRECKVTATIDISKKEGIKALYCGKEKKVRTYLFSKDKDWTMAKAKAWVKEHGKGLDEGIAENRVEKRVDLQGNPSIRDIERAIDQVIRPDEMSSVRRYVVDLYPNKYPDGHVIIEDATGERRKFLDYPYKYNEGAVGLGEFQELKPTYEPKGQRLKDTEEKAYECECIKCGWATTSDKHCKDIKCEKCGGTMRRAERPGPGQESAGQATIEVNADTSKLEETLDKLREKYSDILEIKEGRVLSTKNRKLVKQCADMLLALYEATEKVEPDKAPNEPYVELVDGGEEIELVDAKVDAKVDDKIEVDEDLIEQKIKERLAANGGKKLTREVLEELADEVARLTGKIRER